VREFVAVDVEPADPQGRRTNPAHLTLRFLGEVLPTRNEAISTCLSEVARRCRPFTLRLEGVGAFPTPARPRVVWVGVTTGREEVAELARQVRAALEPEFGADPDPFVPHLTLFRVRSPADRRAAEELLAGLRPAPPPREVLVDRLLLKESVLNRPGAVHRNVGAFPLGAGERTSG
jgi:RNA 2',3'-cyclic 3'-phosphodiesterase